MEIQPISQSQFQQLSDVRQIISHDHARKYGTIGLENLETFGGCDLNSIQLKGDRKAILVELIPELIPTSRC